MRRNVWLARNVRVPGVTVLLSCILGCTSLTGSSRPVTCLSPDVTVPRPVIVEVPEVYELANIILALTNYETLAAHTVLAGPYLAPVRAHFDQMRDHPLVAALGRRLVDAGHRLLALLVLELGRELRAFVGPDQFGEVLAQMALGEPHPDISRFGLAAS